MSMKETITDETYIEWFVYHMTLSKRHHLFIHKNMKVVSTLYCIHWGL